MRIIRHAADHHPHPLYHHSLPSTVPTCNASCDLTSPEAHVCTCGRRCGIKGMGAVSVGVGVAEVPSWRSSVARGHTTVEWRHLLRLRNPQPQSTTTIRNPILQPRGHCILRGRPRGVHGPPGVSIVSVVETKQKEKKYVEVRERDNDAMMQGEERQPLDIRLASLTTTPPAHSPHPSLSTTYLHQHENGSQPPHAPRGRDPVPRRHRPSGPRPGSSKRLPPARRARHCRAAPRPRGRDWGRLQRCRCRHLSADED
jgi:hypothetical protein